MRRLLTVIFAVVTLALSAAAQSTVTWTASTKMTSKTEGTLTITGTIEPGWHIYGLTLPEGGPNPTKVSFTRKGVEFTGELHVSPAPVSQYDSMFDLELTFWENKVVFTRNFKITHPKETSLQAQINYMCCDNEQCRPPKTDKIDIKLTDK